MATTKAALRERIRRIIEGGFPSARSRVADAQIDYEVAAFVSKALRLQVFEGFKDGDRAPDGAALATYENVPITRRDNGRCVATLPATPMMLPKNMGVFLVYPSGYPEHWFIPLTVGLLPTLRNNKFLSPLCRRSYVTDNRSVTVNSDIVSEGISSLDMILCVSDISACGENDIVPIPQDMEADVIMAVSQLFGAVPTTDRADNKTPSPSNAAR